MGSKKIAQQHAQTAGGKNPTKRQRRETKNTIKNQRGIGEIDKVNRAG